MLTLAFDTATPWGRFALAEDGNLLQYRPLNVMGSYADALLKVVQELLMFFQHPVYLQPVEFLRFL